MVSIVTGNGAGLFNTSRDLLGAGGELGRSQLGRSGERVTVNAANGNLIVQDRDEFLAAVGSDIDLLRTYNSAAGWDGDNGDGWRIGYYRRVQFDASRNEVRRVDADGSESVYISIGDGKYRSTDGAGQYDVVSYDTNSRTWAWVDGDTGLTESYRESTAGNGNFLLRQIKDTEGHAIKLEYNGELITSIASWRSGATAPDATVVLTYESGSSRIHQLETTYTDAVTGSSKRTLTSYEYESNRLHKVITDLTPEDVADNAKPGTTYWTTYDYDGAGRLSTITQADGSIESIRYDDQTGRVTKLTDARGDTFFTYDTVARKTTITDPMGLQTFLVYDEANRLKEVSGAATGGTSLVQKYEYNDKGDLTKSINAKGEATTFEYDDNGALIRRTDAAGDVVEYMYTNGLLTSETTYTSPDPDGVDGPQQATGARTTLFFYDTSNGLRRLVYIAKPDKTVIRFKFNSLGQVASETTYLATTLPSSGKITTTALDRLFLTADASSTEVARTEYAYDLYGQVRTITTFGEATRVSNGVTFLGASHQYRTYDAFGRLITAGDDAGTKNTFTYDGLNRLVTVKDANLATTVYTYDDAGRKTTIKLDNGQSTVQLYGLDGQLVSSTSYNPSQVGLGATSYLYDADGRLRMTEDPTGRRTWNFYDAAGRLQAQIDSSRQLHEFVRDAAGRVVQEISYATLVSPANVAGLLGTDGKPGPLTLNGIRPQADLLADRIKTSFYDAAGRLIASQDPDGYIVQLQYDGASQVVRTIAYANAREVLRLDGSASGGVVAAPAFVQPVEDSVRDRATRNYYNTVGQLVGTLDAEGYLTNWSYDRAGRRVGQTGFATAVSLADRNSTTMPSVTAAGDDDLVDWIYDLQGRLVAEVDGEGHLTEYSYDAGGRLSETRRYGKSLGQRVTWVAASAAFKYVRYSLAGLNNLDHSTLGSPQVTKRTYDARGLLDTETAVDGTVTKYVFDRLQRLTTTIRAYGQDDRSNRVEYDGYGRVWREYDTGNHIVAEHTYDDAGRLISTKDARGYTSVFYYDDAGRLVYTILKSELGGEVTETIYSNFSEVKATVSHANRLNSEYANALNGGKADDTLRAKILALGDLQHDGRTEFDFNKRGQIQRAIDALGHKTRFTYNAFGQLETTVSDVDAALDSTRKLSTTLTYDRRGYLLETSSSNTAGMLVVQSSNEYDAFGRLMAAVDVRGQRTAYKYLRDDGGGRKITSTDAAGMVTTIYDAFERVVQRIDRLNNPVKFEYDDANRKLTTTTAEGIKTSVEYNRHGEVHRITDGAKATTTYVYDNHGNLLTVTDALGNVTQNTYDAGDNLLQVIRGLKANAGAAPTDDGSAITATYTFDAANRVLTQTLGSRKTAYTYDGQGRNITVTDPRNTVTTHGFNAKGELQYVIVDDVTGGLQLKTSYNYDAQSRVIMVIEGDGTLAARRTDYKYDELGRRTDEIVDPNGVNLRTRYEYDAAGHVLIKRNALDEVVWRYRYDEAGRLVDSIDAYGDVTRNVYDAEGRLTATLSLPVRLNANLATASDSSLRSGIDALISGSEAVNAAVYDRDGRLIYSVTAMGEVTRRIYDDAGRVIETVRFFNRLSAPTAVAIGGLAAQAANLAANGIDLDQHAYARYDAAGRMSYTVDATGAVTRFEYDRNGTVVKQSRYANRIGLPLADGADPVVTLNGTKDRVDFFLYDRMGRMVYHVDAENYVSQTEYDDAKGIIYSRRYADPLKFNGAPTATDLAALSSVGAVTVSSEVDRAGRVVSETGGTGLRKDTVYDQAGRVKSVTLAKGFTEETTTSYSYNTAGQLISMTVAAASYAAGSADAATTKYQYDARGNLERVIDPRAVPLTTGNGEWEKSERKRLGYAEDLKDLSEAAKQTINNTYSTKYVYDLMGRVIETYRYLEPQVAVTTITQYDAFGNAAVITDARGNKSYRIYDKANRLAQAIDAAGYLTVYGYDAFGNLTSTRHVDAKVSAPATLGATVAYTANDSVDGLSSSTYDKANRLLTQTEWASSTDSYSQGTNDPLNAFGERENSFNKLGFVTRYTYDKLGRLTSEVLPVTSTNEKGVEARDAEGNPILVTNEYQYDSRGNRVLSIEAKGLPEERVTEMRYDADDRLLYRIGRSYTATNADGTTSTVTPVDYNGYDRLGRLVEVVRRGNWSGSGVTRDTGSRSLTYYNARGDVIARIAPDGAYTVYALDAAGNVVSESALAKTVAQPATAGGSPPSATYNVGQDRVTLRVYDQLSRLIEVQIRDLRYWESTGNDDGGFTTAPQTSTLTTVRRLVYDFSGNVVQDIDARGNSVFRYYDNVGRQTFSVDQEGYAISWEYGRHFAAATGQIRYAGALKAEQYVRQDDLSQNSQLRDPERIIKANLVKTDARITEYDLDRLGRISEQRVLGVDSTVVNPDGTFKQTTQSARTQYFYNGLDAVHVTREFVGTGASGEIWNETRIEFDNLGRETQRIAPGFKGYDGKYVNPEVDTKYDGLGAVTRVVQIGVTAAENRATSYIYDHRNGDLVGVIDANLNLTSYAIGANGKPSRVTISVKDADGSPHNAIKTYLYDALGRVLVATDVGTGEVRRTRYNAFGEVSERALGSGAVWQEFIDYNVLGKVERSNSGDGVTRIYLYDRNGNATRQIMSTGTDLRTKTVADAAVDATLIHSFSVYNARNLLIKTADIKISYLMDQTTLSGAFMKQLTDLYGAITVDKPNPIRDLPTGITGSSGTFYAAPITGATASTLMPSPSGVAYMDRTWVVGAVRTGSVDDLTLDSSSNASGTYIRFSTDLVPGGNGIVYYREAGVGDWTAVSISNYKSGKLPAANNSWALYIATANGNYYRASYKVTGGVATLDSKMASVLQPLSPALDIPIAFSTALISQSVMTIEMRLNGVLFTATINSSDKKFSIPWAALEASSRLGVNRFTTRSLSYQYTVYAAPTTTTERRNVVGSGSGTCQAGCDGTQNIPSTVATQNKFFPWVKLSVANANLTGKIELTDASGNQYAALPPLDLRRYDTGIDTLINLQDFIPASGVRTINLSYTTIDAKFTGKIDLRADGFATLRDLVSTPLVSPTLSITIPGAARLSVLHLLLGSGDPRTSTTNLVNFTTTGPDMWTFNWPIYKDQTGLTLMYYEAVDESGNLVAKGVGSYFVGANGQVSQASMTPDPVPDFLTLTPPANTADFTLKYRPRNSQGAWTPVSRGNGLIVDGNRLRLPASALMPQGGSLSSDYEYVYEAKNANGDMLSKGGGTFQVMKSGAVVSTSTYQERVPLAPIVFKGSPGRTDAAYMKFTYTSPVTGVKVTEILKGLWIASPAPGYFQYSWDKPFGGRSINSEENYSVELALCADASGNVPVKDEAGNAIVTHGVMRVGGASEKPWEIKQEVVSLIKDAQVRRLQTWNAFGEIATEFDDRVLDRAQAQVDFYNITAGLKGASPYVVDATAVTTKFEYNTLGKLISKTDPETFETLENGFIRRTRPVTRYGYDLVGRMTVSTDANQHQIKVSYDGSGELNRTQWAADGGESKQLADIFGDVRLFENPLHVKTQQDYDNMGHVTLVHHKDVTRVEDFSANDPTGAKPVTADIYTSYMYDALGRRISSRNALGGFDKTWYDDIGRVTKTRSALGLEASYRYDFVKGGATDGAAVLGVGGDSVGGYKLTTTGPDGRSIVDKIDYFGRTTWHEDLNSRDYTYVYNRAGQLTKQTSSFGQNIEYRYLQNGLIAEIRDLAMHTLTRYGYDDAGNRTSESYGELSVVDKNDVAFMGASYQTSTIAYDELGRIARVWDGDPESTDTNLSRAHDVRYEYDAVGNRRVVHAIYLDPLNNSLRHEDKFFYTYDAANRFIITKGLLNYRGTSASDTSASIGLGVAGSQAVKLGYDAAGQRTSATTADGTVETYTYTSDGYLEDTLIKTNDLLAAQLRARRRVDALGRTIEYKEWNADKSVRRITDSIYDADGRIKSESVRGGTTADGISEYRYYDGRSETVAKVEGSGALAEVVFTAAGSTQPTNTTYYKYEYWDSAKQKSIETGKLQAGGTTSLKYDVNGHLSEATDTTNRTFKYTSNAQGLVLQRTESKGTEAFQHFYYYADGRRIGDVTTDPTDDLRVSYAEQLAQDINSVKPDKFKNFKPITSADFDQNYEPIKADYPGAAATAYTVRSGDTLRSIAQFIWGDSAMWYLIAEVNGLRENTPLAAGQVLVIPNKVTNIHNNAWTWRPYKPGEAIGNISPAIPTPPNFENTTVVELRNAWLASHPGGDWTQSSEFLAFTHYMDATRGPNGIGGPTSLAGLDMGWGSPSGLASVPWTSGNSFDVHNKSPSPYSFSSVANSFEPISGGAKWGQVGLSIFDVGVDLSQVTNEINAGWSRLLGGTSSDWRGIAQFGLGSAIGGSLAEPSIKTLGDGGTDVQRMERIDIGKLDPVEMPNFDTNLPAAPAALSDRGLLNAADAALRSAPLDDRTLLNDMDRDLRSVRAPRVVVPGSAQRNTATVASDIALGGASFLDAGAQRSPGHNWQLGNGGRLEVNLAYGGRDALPVSMATPTPSRSSFRDGMLTAFGELGVWGEQQGGILGGAAYWGGGAGYVLSSAIPGSETELALGIAAGPLVGKGLSLVTGAAVSKFPVFGRSVGDLWGMGGVGSTETASFGATSPLGKVVSSHTAIDPGPLDPGIAGTFAGGRYSVVQLENNATLYRAGTADKPLGQFFDTAPPLGVIQTRIDKAVLPVWPGGGTSPIDTSFAIGIPKGTTVYIGEVGSQGGFYVGGTQQVVVLKPWMIDGVQVLGSTPLR